MPGGENLFNRCPWQNRDGKCVKPEWGYCKYTKSRS